MNQGFITGRIVTEPEVKETMNSNLITFQIANNDKYRKNEAGQVEYIGQFFWIKYWNKSGRMKEHLWKGQEVSINYELEHDTWTDQEGNRKSRMNLLAIRVEPHHWSRSAEGKKEPEQQPSAFDDDVIPF